MDFEITDAPQSETDRMIGEQLFLHALSDIHTKRIGGSPSQCKTLGL